MFRTRQWEDIMDNFITRLSQKINPQDSIKANLMADAKEKEQMKNQLDEYAALLDKMRELYEKQEASAEELKGLATRSDDFTHKECVKVYRNVQALLDKQDELLKEESEKLQAAIEANAVADVVEQMDVANKKSTIGMKIAIGFTLFFTLLNTAAVALLIWMYLYNLNIF